MKKVFLTFSLLAVFAILSSFTVNKQAEKQRESDCWAQTTTTTCGTTYTMYACSAESHYELAVLNDEFDCGPQ